MADTKTKRIQIVGPVGTGKTFLFASLLTGLMERGEFTYVGDNEAALNQLQNTVMGGRPQRTKEAEVERFDFVGGGKSYQIHSTPGEWISRTDTAESISLADVIKAVQNDLCILTINPFKSHQAFGHLVFVAYVAELQRKMRDMTLGEACRTATITMFDLLWDNFEQQLGDIRWTKLFAEGGLHEEIVIRTVKPATLEDVGADFLASCFELSRRDGEKITDNDREMIFRFLGEPARMSYLDSGRSQFRLMRLSQDLNYEPIYFLSRMDVFSLVRQSVIVDFVAVYKRLFEGVPVSFSNIWSDSIATPEIFATVHEGNGRMRVNLEPKLVAPFLERVLDASDKESPRSMARTGLLNEREKDLAEREARLNDRMREIKSLEAELRRLNEAKAPSGPSPRYQDLDAWEKNLQEREARIAEVELGMEEHLAKKFIEGKSHHLRTRTLPILLVIFVVWSIWFYVLWWKYGWYSMLPKWLTGIA